MEQQNFSPPSSAQQPSQKSIKLLWLVILLVLVIALVGVLLWQRNTANQIADSLQQQNANLLNNANSFNQQGDSTLKKQSVQCIKERGAFFWRRD